MNKFAYDPDNENPQVAILSEADNLDDAVDSGAWIAAGELTEVSE